MRDIFKDLRAVLFDLDGTLVDTNIDFTYMKQAVIGIAEKYNVPNSIIRHLDILHIIDVSFDHIIANESVLIAENMKIEAYDKLAEIEINSSYKAVLVDNALDLLNKLKKHDIKICIVTRNCRRASDISISRTGIFYDMLLTRDDVQFTKPHPDHLLTAVYAYKFPSEKCMMIGDHWMDMQAGISAGMKTIGFLRDGVKPDFFEKYQPDIIIRSLSELLNMLDVSEC